MSICLLLHSACVRNCQRGFVKGQRTRWVQRWPKDAYEAVGVKNRPESLGIVVRSVWSVL